MTWTRSSCWTAARSPDEPNTRRHPPPWRSPAPGTGGPRSERRPCTDPVRVDEHLPLPLRPGDDRAQLPGRGAADDVASLTRSGAPSPHEVLRHVARDQCRDRCRHRPRAGVPVRHELVRLLPVRGRRLRGPTRNGRPRGILLGVDVPRALAVRVGSAPAPHPPCVHLGGCHWRRAVRGVHPRRQLMDATSGRLHHRSRHGPPGAERHPRGVHEPRIRVGGTPCDHRVAGDGRARHVGSLGVAPPSRQRLPGVPAHRGSSRSSCWCRRSS